MKAPAKAAAAPAAAAPAMAMTKPAMASRLHEDGRARRRRLGQMQKTAKTVTYKSRSGTCSGHGRRRNLDVVLVPNSHRSRQWVLLDDVVGAVKGAALGGGRCPGAFLSNVPARFVVWAGMSGRTGTS